MGGQRLREAPPATTPAIPAIPSTSEGDQRSVRRTRLVGAQAELSPDWRYHAFWALASSSANVLLR
jgi:hypothetical protein